MGLMAPGIGSFGTLVNGEQIAFSIQDGETGHIAKITIPEKGVWLVTASAWVPGYDGNRIISGELVLKNVDGYTTASQGIGGYTFSLTGIEKVETPATEYLDMTNRTGKTVSGSSLGAFHYTAVKIGEV